MCKPYDNSASVIVLTAAEDACAATALAGQSITTDVTSRSDRAVGSCRGAPLVGVAVVDCTVELFEIMTEPCGVPTREFVCACGDLRYRNEARGSVGSGFAVWYEVRDRDTVSGNGKALTLLHAAHDRAAIVSQFPLTHRCRHAASVA